MSYAPARRAGAVRTILGAIISAVFLVVIAVPAPAHTALRTALHTALHTALKASSPKDGGEIDLAPSRLVLEFTGPIVDFGYRVAVRGPDGRAYQAGAPRVGRATLTQPLKPLGPPGEYQVTFRVVAEDGHPLVSGITFTLTHPGPAAGGDTAVAPTAPLAAVPPSSLANSTSNAPPWTPWLAGAIAVIVVLAVILLGRRATRDLD